MKICITSTGEDLKSKIDPRFGRAEFFIIYDTETKENEVIKNPYLSGGGAGIKAGQLMIDKGINLVISGSLGPNAKLALEKADIKFKAADLTKLVEENLKNLKKT